MDIKQITVSALASVVVVALAFTFFAPQDGANGRDGKNGVGVPGVSLYPQSVTTFTQGGGITATSTANAAATLLGTDLDTENYVAITPTGAELTLTLPASTTFPGIPNAGDMRQFIIENAATAATGTIIAAGTGLDLQEPDGQNVNIGQNNYAVLTAVRMSNTDIMVSVDENIPAD